MKKLICVVLTLIMVLGLVACQSEGTETEASSADTSQQADSTTESTEETSASTDTTEVEFPEMDIRVSEAGTEDSTIGKALNMIKEYIEEATDGKVTVSLYFNSTLCAQDQDIAEMMAGNMDMYASGPQWIAEYKAETSMFGAAYLFNGFDHWETFYTSDLWNDYKDSIAEELGIRVLNVFTQGARQINLRTDKKITSRADMEGVLLRMPNTESWQFMGEALGANPMPVNFSDLYLALQTGTVDGQDNGLSTIKSNAIYEVTKSITLTTHQFSTNWLVIREDLWQSMSPELQQVVQEAVDYASTTTTDNVMEEEATLASWMEEQGLTVYELTAEEQAAYAQEVLDYYLADDTATADWNMDLFEQVRALAD